MNIYDKLLKIKKPVLIEVKSITYQSYRYRILYPNGKCEYTKLSNIVFDTFVDSCFSRSYDIFLAKEVKLDLKTTVTKMKTYDRNSYLKIVKFEEI
jgi:hypothetical protein